MQSGIATCYLTYGYNDGTSWRIPIRIWLHKKHDLLEAVFTGVVEHVHNRLTPEERDNFRLRAADLLADDIHFASVTIIFDGDPTNERYVVTAEDGSALQSDLNGLIEGIVTLPFEKARLLLEQQASRTGWLKFRTADGPQGVGSVQLIEPQGHSVISDIDDTIKITEIPAGIEIVARNTFFRNFAAVSEMAARYAAMENTVFHYVSGAPWQLYLPEAQFLIDGPGRFPAGTFHLKTVDKNLLSAASWENLEQLAGDRFDLKIATLKQKTQQIERIFSHFPNRSFTLFGDSGEMDPEVYSPLKAKYGDQIKEIWIRDVVNATQLKPSRLKGMNRIDAPTIEPGHSQFG